MKEKILSARKLKYQGAEKPMRIDPVFKISHPYLAHLRGQRMRPLFIRAGCPDVGMPWPTDVLTCGLQMIGHLAATVSV